MTRAFGYPVADHAEWRRIAQPGPSERLSLRLRDLRYRRRAGPADPAGLRKVGAAWTPPPGSAVVLLCVVRNAGGSLASFLAHYRAQGVERFAFVDDASDDGTAEILAGESDVDLFTAPQRFREAGGGLTWRDALIDLYGRDRWYVSVDADEYLLYPDCETRSLRDFISDLEAAGLKRCLAPMLDLYPGGRLGDAVFDPARHRSPIDLAPLIDGDGYRMSREKFCLSVRGGPRTRLFGGDNRLSKFPVLFADAEMRYHGGSIHGPLPITRNFGPVAAVLLHFKFSAASLSEFRAFVERGEHFGGAMFYRRITESPAFGEDLSLRYPGSLAVSSSADLVRRGFMEDLRARKV